MNKKTFIYISMLLFGFLVLGIIAKSQTLHLASPFIIGATGDTVKVGINQDNPQSELNVTGNIGATGEIAGTFIGNGTGLIDVGDLKNINVGTHVIEETVTAQNLNETNITIAIGKLESDDILVLEYYVDGDYANQGITIQPELHLTSRAGLIGTSLAIATDSASEPKIGVGIVKFWEGANGDDILGQNHYVGSADDTIETVSFRLNTTGISNVFANEQLVLQIDGYHASSSVGNTTIKYKVYKLN